MNVAEDFEELLSDKAPDLTRQFVQSKRSLLENAFTEFVRINFFFKLFDIFIIIIVFYYLTNRLNSFFFFLIFF